MIFKDKNIVLCITGGIAAYKSVNLASELIKKGANVYSVLTKNACKFITPLTLKTITRNKVTIDMFDETDFIPHISLAELADLVIVAPATANIIAKASNGIADDMTSTLLLSTNAKKIIIPAMNTNMYLNQITQKNISILKQNGYIIMSPEEGRLACREDGIGRFPEINNIIKFIEENTISNDSYKDSFFLNKKILITLGGTIEEIDPVRYLTNKSSGKMGFSFAKEFIERGGLVKLIIGNADKSLINDFKTSYKNIEMIFIKSANELYKKIIEYKDDFDFYLMASAVADYTVDYSENKIKKGKDDLKINLKKTIDILKNLPKRKEAIYIGFAAESENLLENAILKIKDKKLDFLIANSIIGEKSALGNDYAEVHLLNKWNNEIYTYEYTLKDKIACNVLDKIIEILKN